MKKSGGNIKTSVTSASGAKSIASKAPAQMSGKIATGNGPYSSARVVSKMRSGKSKTGHEGE